MSTSGTDGKRKVPVNFGSSLLRALNSRKTGSVQQNNKVLKEFYSFRYNFKPPSVDVDQRGKLVVGANNNVTVERPSSQSSEAHKWVGQEAPAKEWDCVLIYDETSKSGLTANKQAEPMDDLEQELLDAAAVDRNADADGEDYFSEIVPDDLKKEEEEEEEEEGEVLPSPVPPPKKPVRAKPTPASNPEKLPQKTAPAPTPKLNPKPVPKAAPVPSKATKPPPAAQPAPPRATKPTATALPTPSASTTPNKPQPKPQASTSLPRGKKNKRDNAESAPPAPSTSYQHLSDADEELLQFGKPTKRAKPSPPQSQAPPQQPWALALPEASTAAFIPPAPAPSTAAPIEVGLESEEEEEWDEVAAVDKPPSPEDDFDIFGEAAKEDVGDGDDIGMDELERELNMQMDEVEVEDEDEDFLAAVVEEVPSRGAPMSLKELANGASYASDDYSSSSEESDDD
ncbi:hypothetical protein H0H93_005960 [Arthromyces matolae]|nr:hypothetical protein H0H93_005960 [Arthromyces matolae]